MLKSLNLLPFNGEVYHQPHFFSPKESSHFYKILLNEQIWQRQSIQLFGKKVMQPRKIDWAADEGVNYKYSGLSLPSKPWSKPILAIKQKVEIWMGCSFNSVLANLYSDGKEYMGWHQDNEPELGLLPTIVSVSFGATRTFSLKSKSLPHQKINIELTSGSVLVMKGKCQFFWKHSLPKRLKVVEPRINLTFRQVLKEGKQVLS